MSVVAHKLELFENIARLRRAAREMPGNKDLAAVRAALEDELGPDRLAAPCWSDPRSEPRGASPLDRVW